MKILIFTILAVSNTSYSQLKTFIVADSLTEKAVEFPGIIYGKGKGNYGNERGEIIINTDTVKSIIVTGVGYEDKKVDVVKNKDTVFLMHNSLFLDEVVINKTNGKLLYFNKRSSKSKISWPLIPTMELIAFFKPDVKAKNAIIREIVIPCYMRALNNVNGRIISETNENVTDKFIFTLRIYNLRKELVFNDTFTQYIQELSKGKIVYTLPKDLEFDNQGLYFGIECIGWFNNFEFIPNTFDNISKKGMDIYINFIKVKEHNTYTKTIFDNEGTWRKFTNKNDMFKLDVKGKPLGVHIQLGLIKTE